MPNLGKKKGVRKTNLKNWLIQKLGGYKTVTMDELLGDENVQSALSELYLRELAFLTCVNKIANALSKCEFKTYIRGEEKKESEYYRWNVSPNRNQNATTFVNKLISELYKNNEALVVEVNNQLFVADSFAKEIRALTDYRFTGVTVENYTFSDTFYQSDVLYFQLNHNNIRKILNGMYESYSKLIAYASKAYQKSRGNRGIVMIGAIAQSDKNFSERFQKLMSEHFKNFFQSENAVLPLFDGYDYNDLTNSKTYSSESTRDIKALADDIFEFTARAISFPPSLAKGDVQDTGKAIDELLTFVIDPLAKMLEQEINRKTCGEYQYREGTYIKINTVAVKHIDLFDIATPIDKLISSGAFTINDILEVIGKQKINEEWADTHFMTKNYSTISDLLTGLEKGESKNAEDTTAKLENGTEPTVE